MKRLNKLETKLLHALQYYTREHDEEVRRLRFEKYLDRKKKKVTSK